jgi:hypothetical protein
MIEPQTVQDGVRLIFEATHNSSMEARVAFDKLMERVLNRRLNDAQRDVAWYEYLGLFIVK